MRLTDEPGLALIAVTAIGFVVLAVYIGVQEQKQWQAFAKAHDCKKVAEIAGYYSTGFGVMSNGKMGTVSQWNPSRTTYHCNDGVDYTR